MRLTIFLMLAAVAVWLGIRYFPQPEMPANPVGEPTSADITYHAQVFNYVMEHMPAGQRYDWRTESAIGGISGEAYYKSKSGAICRKYKEEVRTEKSSGALEGVACRRSSADGWCRIPPKDSIAQTCAMEKRILDFNVGGLNFATPDFSVNLGEFEFDIGTPNVTMPNPSLPEAPKTDKVWNIVPKRGQGESAAQYLLRK